MAEKKATKRENGTARSSRSERFCPKWSASEISVTTPKKKAKK